MNRKKLIIRKKWPPLTEKERKNWPMKKSYKPDAWDQDNWIDERNAQKENKNG